MDKPKTEIVAGRNPVLELLRSPREVECVYIQSGLEKGPVGRILALARERGIPVKDVAPEKLQSLSGIASHQGVAAQPAAAETETPAPKKKPGRKPKADAAPAEAKPVRKPRAKKADTGEAKPKRKPAAKKTEAESK